MRKKMFTWFSLATLLISFVAQPLVAVAEGIDQQGNTLESVVESDDASAVTAQSDGTDQTKENSGDSAEASGEDTANETADEPYDDQPTLRGPTTRAAKDVSDKVTTSGLDIRVNSGSGWYDFIKNGSKVPGAVEPIPGNQIRFEYKWNITSLNLANINAGDYFYFDLPKEYFSYKDTAVFDLKDSSSGETLGTYQIVNGKIKITLNETAVKKDSLKNGYVYADGTVVKSGDNIVIETEDGIKLPDFNIGKPGGASSNYPNSNVNPISKNGTQVTGQNVANWDVLLNYDNLSKRYNGEAYDTLENAFFIDELQGAQTFKSLKIQTVLYTAMDNGNMSNNAFAYTDVSMTSWGNYQIKEKQPTTETTVDAFKATLKAGGEPAWGVINNTVVIFFGDVPSSQIVLPDSMKANNYKGINDALAKQETDGKITNGQRWTTYNHFLSGAEDEVISFQVTIQTDIKGNPDKIVNQAQLVYDNNEVISNEKEIDFQEVGGGATGVEAKAVKIVKQDDDGNLLKGVTFKLTKWNDSTSKYEDYTSIDGGAKERTTDENGEIIFGKLEAGKYKIVEVTGLEGYSDPQYSPSDEFEIKDSDKVGVLVQVTNPKIKPTSLALEAKKLLDGRELAADDFKFELLDKAGTVIQTKGNAADGTINFDAITYDKAGTYEYTIREVQGSDSTITYDKATYKVTVKVEDKAGQLVATPSYSGDAAFKNTYKPAPGSAAFKGKKVRTGKTLAADAFSFELKDENGNILQTKQNDANGDINFDAIAYDKEGTFKYKVSEVNGGDGTITYDPKVFEVTVTVKDVKGKLVATVSYSGDMTFNNSYKPTAGSAVIKAQKVLTGKELAAGEFDFELKDANGTVLQTKSNDIDGNVFFDAINFTVEGTYEYTISEVKGTDSTITYDKQTVKVTIAVVDQKGTLVPTVTYDSDAIFNNSYKPAAGSAIIEAEKSLTGKTLTAGEFSFTLTDENDTILQTKQNDASGKVYFDAINYDKEGTYKYTIAEVKGSDSTITYDTTKFTATVKVTDVKGKLTAVVTYSGDAIFENTYEPKAGSAVIEAAKSLTGKELIAGEFSFELKDDQGTVLQTKQNDASGKIFFDAINYDQEGTFNYTISEVASGDSTITYDPTVFQVTVTVKDVNGQLTPTVTYSGDVTFKNSYEPAAGSAVIEAEKVLTGKGLAAGEFSFELKDDQGKVLQTKQNDASGKVYFDAIDYDKKGTYEYTISEVDGGDSTITYDNAEIKVTVEVKDVKGQLTATVTYEKDAVFNNVYQPADGSAVIEAAKTLSGKELLAGEFSFELKDDQGNVLQTKQNDANGNVYFDAISYKKAGTFEYTINEVNSGDSTITYDDAEIKVTVKVEDVKGKLTATVTYASEAVFKNTYKPAAGSAEIEAEKQLSGKELTAGEFSFELKDDQGKVLQTKENTADGKINFDAIDYSKAGTHEYTINEVKGSDTTITYAENEIKVTVTVTDQGGQLIANVSYDSEAVFKNSYAPQDGKAEITALKQLTGKELTAGEFSFELKDDQGNVLQTRQNAADGSISFDAINYDQVGTHTYTITEAAGNDSTISYDTTIITVTVVVTDNKGQLEAAISYDSAAIFENAYTPAAGSAVIEAEKRLVGKELTAGEFSFELKDDQGKVLQTKQNDAFGKIYFDAIPYDKAGTYEYTISEAAGSDSTITYDQSTHKVTVTVTDVNGQMEAVVSYDGQALFENSYTPAGGSAVIEAMKQLTGKELTAGEFSFELKDADGKVLQTKQNDADGKIYFDAINYDKAGTHEYTISEVSGGDSSITYDAASYKVIVKVTDEKGQLTATVSYEGDATFKNTYTPAAGAAVLEADKQLTGKELTVGEFSFELVDEQGDVLQTKQNDASGKVYFDAINYDAVGTYNYTIREVAGNDDTITYDATVYSVSVIVSDINGQLTATPSYGADAVFHNNYTPKDGSVVLEAEKQLTGKELSAGEFSFDLLDEQGKVLQTKQNAADGKVYFDAISFKKAGTYSYTIREAAGSDSTISYDQSTFDVTVTVVDKDGQMVATPSYDGNVVFTNSYTPAKGSVVLQGAKQLTGKELTAGEFDFTLTDAAGNILQTKQNDAAGNIYFDAISYDQVGTYEYTIAEAAGNDSGIAYDTNTYKATVTVTDKKGQLTATVSYSGDVIFKNSYTPADGSAVIAADKELTGREMTAGEFSFELVDADGKVLQTKQNAADGKIYFDAIAYDAAGSYDYTVREVKGSDSSITYDESSFKVTVTVVDQDGALVATPVFDAEATFKNTYKPAAGSIALAADKELIGKEMTAGEFSFELLDEAGKVIQTKQNAADGKIYFDAIDYDKAGIYVYSIREVQGGDETITYDNGTHKVQVEVKDEKGKLTAKATYEGEATFTNVYAKPDLGKFTLKKIDSETKELLADAEFELQDMAGNVLREDIVTGQDGTIVVGNLEPGDYQLIETKAPEGYQLDETPIKVTIVENQEAIEAIEFHKFNTKETNGVMLKKVDGDSGQALANAEFEIKDAKGNSIHPEEKLVSDDNGVIYLEDLPEGEYTLTEIKAPIGYQIDQTPVEFTVKNNYLTEITMKNFKAPTTTPSEPNTPNRPWLPQTGSTISYGITLIGLLFISMTVVLFWFFKRNQSTGASK